MLGVKEYEQNYVDECRARVDKQAAAYKKLKSAAGTGKAVDTFEPLFFNSMVIVLDALFMHRLRGQEGKDGNPLNEVRVLCESMLQNGNVLMENPTIKLKPETSVLGLKEGDPIALSESDFKALSKAYFDEIEKRFV